MSSPISLDVRISKRFAARHHQFSLDVQFSAPAGVTVLFGPSGSGKTTILECIAGLLTPDSGRIALNENSKQSVLFDSQSRVNLPANTRNLGYVFQTLALFPHLTVEENVGYGLSRLPSHERTGQVDAILESFHIPHLSRQRPDRISGGERQRVALARSLVTRPRALLLDEPLSALDYETKSKIIADLRAMTRVHRIPVIYVTHALDEVFALGERVITLEKGSIVKQGSPSEVLATEREQLIRELQGANI
ncbi:MAG: putative transporter ATP-binding protein [Candidatus Angelobacter sp.]|jgi:molybdate transport system ATP-binding protein|nr:putative transporter ATP-binding protein [Candidatus Angelobacter sp.]